jgi:hypothetical protein
MPEFSKKQIFLNRLLLTSAVFLLVHAVLALVIRYMGMGYFDVNNWSRWDSDNYLWIADKGYEYMSCSGVFDYPVGSPYMCGNAGWFPGYPMLIRLFGLLVSNAKLAGLLVSQVFLFHLLYLVLVLAGIRSISMRSFLFLCLTAFNFGFIYYHAIFPVSAVVFMALLALHSYRRGNKWLCGLLCFLIATFYPSGFLLGVVFTLYQAVKNHRSFKAFLLSLPYMVLGILGLLTVFGILQLSVNDWQAFLKVQAKLGNNGFHNPIGAIVNYITPAFKPYKVETFQYYQAVIVLLALLTFLVLFIVKKGYRNDLHLWCFIYLNVFFFFPWIVGEHPSVYRADALLLPCLLALKDARMPLLLGLLALMLVVGIPVCSLFFRHILI